MRALHQSVLEMLLSGKTICRHTNELEFNHLSDSANQDRVALFMGQLGRRLRQSGDGDGFVLVHTDPSSATARKEARWGFELMAAHLRPVVGWMALAMKCDPLGHPLKAGQMVREADLLTAISDSPSVDRELEELCRIKPFLTESTTARGRLSRVLSQLVEMGYLVPVGKNETQFQATAAFSFFDDYMEFIREYEQLEAPADDGEQLGLGS